MICLLPELSALHWSSLKYWSVSSGPVIFLGYPRLRSNIFNIIIVYYSETFVLASRTSCCATLWGLSAEDGTLQAAVISVIVQLSIFQTYLLYPPAHTVWLTDPQQDDSGKTSPTGEPSVSVWPETWMYSCTGAHQPPSLNQCGPILPDTSALCCRNLEDPTCTSSNLNTVVAVFFFLILPVCCTDWWCKNQSPYFFSSWSFSIVIYLI